MRKNFILFCILCATGIRAQTKDSLLRIIHSSASDSVKHHALYELGWELIYSDPDSSYAVAGKAFSYAHASADRIFESKVLNLIGSYFRVKGDYVKAIENYQKSLKIGENLNDNNIMLVSTANIGAIYLNLEQYAKAKEFELKSLKIAEKTNNKEHLASLYSNLSMISSYENMQKQAIEYGEKSLDLYKKLNDKNGICSAAGNLGNALSALGQYDKALENFRLCYNTSREVNNVTEEATVLINIADIYRSKKDYKAAISYYNKADVLCRENEIPGKLRGVYEGLYYCYKKMNNLEKALQNYEKYFELAEESKKESEQSEVNKRMIEFEFNKKAVADSIRNAEENKYKDAILQASKKKIEKDRQLQIALTVGLIFIIIFAVLIFNRFRITSKQKQIIEIKNKQTEEQKLIIEEKQKEILDSITYAKKIQDSLLDDFESVRKFFSDAFLIMMPKDIVSGDFYWLAGKVFQEADHVKELFYVAVCDSTGHGVPGGFMSLLNMAYLNEAINERNIYEPGKIFDYARERLCSTISKGDQSDGFDGTLLCFERHSYFRNGQPASVSTKFSYASAYNAPLIIRSGEVTESKTNKMPVGFSEKITPFTTFTFDIQQGDLVYIFSDGYIDQFGGPREKKFQLRQLQELLVSLSMLPAEEQKDKIVKRFYEWKGPQMQMDDVSMIGIRI
jgi:serine phosphatase RsbU (regulator of sigma subunit)